MATSQYSPVSPTIEPLPSSRFMFGNNGRGESRTSDVQAHFSFESHPRYAPVLSDTGGNLIKAPRFREHFRGYSQSSDAELIGEDDLFDPNRSPSLFQEAEEEDDHVYDNGKPLVEKYLEGPKKDYRFFLVLGGMCLAWFTRGMDDTIVSTINAELAEAFHDLSDIAWYGSAYLFPQATLTLFFGKLTTKVNLNYSWLICTTTFMAGSVVCAMARSSIVFILGRALTGLAVAAIGPTGLTMLTHITTPEERPGYIALIVGVETLSLSIGPIAGSLLTEKLNYRWCFIIGLPLAVISCLMVVLSFKQPPRPKRRGSWYHTILEFDPLGCILMVTSTLLLVLGLQFAAQSSAWRSAKVIVTLTLSGVLLVAFLIQLRFQNPELAFIPHPVLNRGVGLALGLGFMVVFANHVLSFYLPFYYQDVRDTAVIKTAILLLPFLMVGGFCSLATGYGLNVTRYPNLFMYISCVFLIVGMIFISHFDVTTPIPQTLGFEAIAGIGSGMGQVLGITSVEPHVPMEYKSFSLSMALTAQLLGATLGIAIGGNLLNTQITSRIESSALSVAEKALAIANASDTKELKKALSQNAGTIVAAIFAKSVQDVFLIGLGAAVVAFILVVHIKWTPRGGVS